jgi:uncharacterized UPF0160 family protein
MRVATHDGSFHADDVFAVAALTLLNGDDGIEVVRTRDRDVLATADLRVDVGFRDDPATGDFDHHQRGFDRARANGVGYASFGLIWDHYGARIAGGDREIADVVDASLVQTVDANDTGQRLTETIVEGAYPMSVSSVIAGLQPRWDETLDPAEERARFDDAVALAAGVLQREIESAAAAMRAVDLARAAIAAASDPRLIELGVDAPWKRTVVPEAPEALFVIYPKRQGFGLEAVPRQLGSFENRRDLPAAWAGLEGEDLVEVTGVPDALFCHAKRFLAVARTREGIGRLAELALADD